MTRRVLLHVGAPKTGTSFVQDILFTNREALRERGILYAADRHDAHFLAALDLMELPWGGLEREAAGAWDRLADEVREWPGTAIISHEILGRASRVQVARALESLGHPDTEIHVVFSARDLVRQIPAEWQENVKHRRTKTYGALPGEPAGPRPQRRGGPVVLGRPGGPRRARPVGGDPPPRAGAPGHRPPAGLEPDPAVGAVRRACSASTRPSSPRPARRTPRSAYPSRRWCAASTCGSTTRCPTTTTGTFVRELVVHRNLSGRAGSPRLSLPDGRPTLGQRPRPFVGQRARAAGVRRRRHPRRPRARRPARRTSTPTLSTRSRWPRPRSTRSRS